MRTARPVKIFFFIVLLSALLAGFIRRFKFSFPLNQLGDPLLQLFFFLDNQFVLAFHHQIFVYQLFNLLRGSFAFIGELSYFIFERRALHQFLFLEQGTFFGQFFSVRTELISFWSDVSDQSCLLCNILSLSRFCDFKKVDFLCVLLSSLFSNAYIVNALKKKFELLLEVGNSVVK